MKTSPKVTTMPGELWSNPLSIAAALWIGVSASATTTTTLPRDQGVWALRHMTSLACELNVVSDPRYNGPGEASYARTVLLQALACWYLRWSMLIQPISINNSIPYDLRREDVVLTWELYALEVLNRVAPAPPGISALVVLALGVGLTVSAL